jgi:hypothetical protein
MQSMLKGLMHDEANGVIVIHVSESIKSSTLKNIIDIVLDQDEVVDQPKIAPQRQIEDTIPLENPSIARASS